jgi:hypothetical protein
MSALCHWRTPAPQHETSLFAHLAVEQQRGLRNVQPDDDAKMAANDLATSLGRVSEISTREIENLIGELCGLRES